MRFELTTDQRDFAASLESMLATADSVGAARSWAEGDHAQGLALWRRLADQGVSALLTPEEHGGMGASQVELALAFEALGRHVVPGPWVESAAFLPLAVSDGGVLASLAEGALGTVAAPPHVPYALDADVAEHVYVANGSDVAPATVSEQIRSVDGSRRLFVVSTPTTTPVEVRASATLETQAAKAAVLATSAQLLGAGERVLADSVAYVKQRRQFGREIGSYQAIKHKLADVRIALDFARPLVYGAAVGAISPSAAKVQCAEAAYLASRTGLQVHGAIGYTQEFDLSVWLTKIRALTSAWGTTAVHRALLLDELVG